jgi:Domain of unknown function (DUF5664)
MEARAHATQANQGRCTVSYVVKLVDNRYFYGYYGGNNKGIFSEQLSEAYTFSSFFEAEEVAFDLRSKGIHAATEEKKVVAKTETPTFVKADDGKVRADLLPADALLHVAEVLTLGAAKYGADNWRKVDDVIRYKAALMRHVLQYLSGQAVDAESGKSHLAHVACNALFLLELDREK